MRKKTKTEQAEQSAAPIIDAEVVDSTDLATIEPANAEIVTPATYMSVDTDEQVACMRDMAGMMLKRWKRAIEKKQLTLDEEIKLFKEIKPYLGYGTVGNKSQTDIGMDTLAIKYIEVSSHIKKRGRPSTKS